MREHGIKGGEGTMGSVGVARAEKRKPCDCEACADRRFGYAIEAERGVLDHELPFPNAPSTLKLQ